MLDISTLVPTLLKRMKKLPVGEYLDVRSYKRDRYLLIIKTAEGKYRIVERGFEQNEYELCESDLKKTLKTLVKREFPRSNKIRVYAMGPFEVETVEPQRKRI